MRDAALLGDLHSREAVDAADAGFDGCELGGGDEVGLVDDDDVGVGDLQVGY